MVRFRGCDSGCVHCFTELYTCPDFSEAASNVYADSHHVGLAICFSPDNFNKPHFQDFKDLRQPNNGVVWIDEEPVCGAITVRR